MTPTLSQLPSSRLDSVCRDIIRRRVAIAMLAASLFLVGGAPGVAQPLDPDATGILWVGTSTGIFKVEGSRLVLDPDQPGVLSYAGGAVIFHVAQPASPTQLAVDPAGEILWAHTSSTLHALDFEGQPLFTVPLGVPGPATDLAVNPADGSVWLAIGSSVLHFDGSGVALGSFSVPSAIVGLRPDSFNRVWVARSSAVTGYDVGTGTPIVDLDLGKGKTTVADIDVGLWSWMRGQSQSDGLYVLANKGWRSYVVSSGGATPEPGRENWISVPSGQFALAWANMTNGTHVTQIPMTTPNTIPNPLQSSALHIVAEWGHAWIGGGWELARPFDLLADPLLVDLGSGVEVTALAANQPERTPPALEQVMPAQGAWTRFNPPVFELSYDDPPGASDSRVSGVDPVKALISRSSVWLAVDCAEAASGTVCTLRDPVDEGQNSFFLSIFDHAANRSSSVSRTISVDSLPPSMTITSPTDGASLADRLPAIEVSYDDALSGVDTESLAFFANGESLDVSCSTQSTTAASCQPVAPLPGGEVVIEATISDIAGSQAIASVSITIDAEDTSAPIVDVATPTEGEENTSTSPQIDIAFSEQGDGIDPGSLVLLADGSPLDVNCTHVGSAFEGVLQCVPAAALALGPHTIEATLSDLAGNTSSAAVRSFTVVPPFTDVEGRVVKPDGTPAVGAEVSMVGKSASAVADAQGFFTIGGLEVSTGERLTVTATLTEPERSYSTRVDSVEPVYGGITDVGVLSLVELCAPRFSAAFDPPADSIPGRVYALATFDDGSTGPRLFAGGSNFSSVGVAWWTGGGWARPWTFDGDVRDLVVFDDGSGPALYAGGAFTSIDGVAISRLARWNGESWERVGNGFNGTVYELEVLDLGDGPRLFAAGDFTLSDGARVAIWDGGSWSSVGGPLDDEVEVLQTYDDGSGAALYAGGQFVYSDSLHLDHIAKLESGAWVPVGGGVDKSVKALETFDAGNGLVLVAAGTFRVVQGEIVGLVATWDGTAWAAMGDLVGEFGCGSSCVVNDLAVVRAGSETQLFAAGAGFSQVGSRVIAVWDGLAWVALPGTFQEGSFGGVETLLAVDISPNGGGPSLFSGGSFEVLGGVESRNVGELHRSCDATPPEIELSSPSNPTATVQTSVTISGSVTDGVVLFVGGSRVPLGADGSFLSPAISLAEGLNSLLLSALDQVGNQSLMTIQVLRDSVAPTVSFVLPRSGETVDLRRPDVEVAYGDDHGVDGSTLTFRLGGSPISMDCQPGGTGALCRPEQDLPTGSVSLTATITDLAGNVSAQSERTFAVSSSAGPSDTSVVGSVRLPGGVPAVGAEVSILGQRGRTTTASSDGTFFLPGVAASDGAISVAARYRDATGTLAGFVSNVEPVGGGTTDVGVIALGPLCDLELDADFYTGVGVDGEYPEKNLDWSDSHLSARVFALEVFDDGSGPALYVGGRFESAGGIPAMGIARWDGRSWSSLDGGVAFGDVYALEVFDDGSGGGQALYVGGSFLNVGTAEMYARGIARWNGSAWSAVGGVTDGTVRALAVVTVSGTTSLYAGGQFTSIAGVSANHVARWSGQAWSALGPGLGSGVYALASFKAPKGKGQALYAGGYFTSSGSDTGVRRLAVWDGSKWAAAGGGVHANETSSFYGVWALTVFEDRLIVGGTLAKVGASDLLVDAVASWDGRNWSALPGLDSTAFQTLDRPNGGAQALAVYDDGAGAGLYALGALKLESTGEAANIFRWDGSMWSAVGGGLSDGFDWTGMALGVFDPDPSDGLPGELFAGSSFFIAGANGGVNVNGLARWDGSSWSPVPGGVPEPVTGLAALDTGSGRALYVAGYTTDKTFSQNWRPFPPLRWNGRDWLALPHLETEDVWGSPGADHARIQHMATLDDGTGPAVYAVGKFKKLGPWITPGVAKWDGQRWIPFGAEGLPAQPSGTLDPEIDWNVVGMFDGGAGPRLVVAGVMNRKSGVAQWDGHAWSYLGELGDGSGNAIEGFEVNDLAVFSDGQGQPELFVAGGFESVDGAPIAFLARWNGSSWSSAGAFDGAVNALAVFDDGSGPALYATGYFQNVNGIPAKSVARWNGAEWQATGSGLPGWGIELAVAEDGGGERLFVGGQVGLVGGQLRPGIAFWNGSSWEAVVTSVGMSRILGFDDGTGPAVFAGGAWGGSQPPRMSYLKKLHRPLECTAGPDSTPPTLTFTTPANEASVTTARPEIGFAYADAGSGVDVSTLSMDANGVPLPLSCNYLVAEATCAPGADLPSGSVTLRATVRDSAGNVSVPAVIGITVVAEGPPTITISAPTDGAIIQTDLPAVGLVYSETADFSTFGLQSAPQAVGFSCTYGTTAATCTPTSPLPEGENTLTATISGFDGSSAPPDQVTFIVDVFSPSLSFTAPADGGGTNQDPPELRLTYADAGAGVDPSTLRLQKDGIDLPITCTVGPSEAVCTPNDPLSGGSHTLVATVADFAGRISTPAQVSFDIVFDFESPVITLTSPASDSATTASMVQFIGSVSEPVSLTLDGVVVALDESLAFDHGPVSLDEGQNRFELVATDAGGNLSSQTVRVLRDGTPPGLSFIAPTEGTYFDPNVQPFEIRWGDSGTAVDIASLQLTVDGAPLAVTCTACGSGAVCTATTPPAGTVVLGATVADGVGLTASAQVRFTTDPNGDIVAPQILLLAPTSGTATDRSEERFIGDLSEAATLTIGGAPAAVDANHHFDHSPVPLSEGANTIELRATDAAGNVGTLTVALTLDSAPPPPVDVSLVTVGASAGGQVTVTGAAGSVTPVDAGDAVHIENRYSSSASEADLAVDGSFSAVLAAEGGDELALFTRDAAGNRSASRLATVPGTPALPPDPSAVAPALDPTAATGPCQLYEFLYTGAAPIQAGVAADAIDCRGASLLRGRVLDRGGQPVSGVRISVLRGAELGSTLTRGDGVFDFVVPGGSEVVLQFLGTGHLPVHRKVSAPYGTSTTVPDVVLTALDTAVTTVDASGGATTMQVARGGAVTDADGTRRATLLFPAGATARLRYTGGAVEFVASLAIRATEYTVGPEGPAAMPAPLPPTSAYTYAVELSADEALSAGASSLELDRPVLSYTENFLGLPTGVVIPVGYYDRELGRWVAEENGRVIEILSSTGGLADLDVDGTGAPADATRLAELGITDAERTELVTLYSVGQSLWRVRLSHFTPYDYNLPFYPPPGAASPSRPKPRGGDQDKKPCDWTTAGSIIECTNQVLGEDVGVTGTSHSLHYRSDRVPGRKSARTLEVSLSGGSPPASVQRIDLTVDVAGKQLTQGFTPGADLSHSFTWDGRDAFGRTVQGATEATVSVGYVYDATYARPPEDELDAFARAGTSALTANSARDEITLWQRHRVEIGGWDALAQVRLGGWTLSPHHAYDPHSRTLYYGDGGRRTVKDLTVITSAAGTGEPGFAGDDGPADEARLSSPNAIVLSRDAAGTPDGGYYFADTRNCRVRHVDVAGVITTVAGSGCRYAENGLNSAGASGDGGPATAATLHWKLGQIAQGPDGSLYISDAGHTLIRRVTPDGIINTVIGWDWIHGAEPGPTPPTQLQFINLAFGLTVDDAGDIYVGEQNLVNGGVVYRFAYPIYEPEIFLQGKVGTTTNDTGLLHYLRLPHYLAFDVGGNLYISDGWSNSIFWRGWDGSFIELAGGCQTRPDGEFTCTGDAGDGGPATDALLNFPIGISFAADGSVLFVDSGNHRVRRIDSMGRISTVAGTGAPGFNGDGRAARQTQLSAPVGLEVLPEGDVLVADADNNRVRKIRGVLPPVPTTGLILVPEQDGRTRYVFDPTGRHLRTENARTGEVLLTFGYTANGHLSLVTDVFGSTITIERDASGAPQRLVAPFGHETDLAVHPSGYLATIVNPAGEPIGLTYDPEGLLTGLTDPRSNVYTFEYDNLGRLRKDTDPATGSTTLARTELPTAGDVADGFEVTKTTALGRTTRYRTEKLTTGDTRVTVTDSTGLSAVGVQGADGSHATTAPDGTVASAAPGPDPVFGMQTPRLDRFTMTTPGGLSSTATTSRAVSLVNPLGDPDDLANVATVTQTVTVNGKSGTSVLDLVNHLATTTSPEGRASITTYDAFGRLVESSMPGLEPVQYSYDGQGRLQSVSQGPRTMTYTYDATSGFLAKVADTASREVAFTYDAAGRMRTRTLPDLRVVALNYDTNGNLTSVTPPGRPPHVFGHTSVDLVDTYTPPDIGLSQHATVLTYNRDRQVELVTRPDGQTIDPVYDPDSGRRTSVVTPRGSYNYTYDGTSGNLAGVTDPEGGALGFDYDGSLLTSVTWTGEVTGSVEVAHDDDFEIVARSINGADTISYTYDEDGLLTGAGSLTISREADTGFIAATNAGGIADSYTYDPSFGELASYSAVDGGSDLYIASYSRDEVGRIVQKVETLGGAVTTYDYTFSAAGQLTDVDQNGVGLAHYDYDPNANRIAWSDYWGAGTATYDAQDRLTDYAGTTYTYTANGELASKSAGGQTVTYDYDVSGNLRRVVLPDGLTLDYVIDAANRRIGKKVNGSLVQGFLYQGPLNPVAELDGSGVVVSTFVYASKGHVPDLMMKDGATYRIVSDHLGSVRLVVDTTDGTVAQRLDYDAFGRVTFDSNPGFQPFGFAGGLYDRQIGLVRFGARDYDPETGRWTSKDPIGFAGGDLNLYGYVANDPINGNDSSGLYRVDVHYHKTKQWAMEEGFLESEAEVIAAANQGHDAGWWQPFNGLSAFSHFRDTNDVLDDIWSAIPGHDLEYFGFLLHELQDSYSHAGYKAHSGGHALRWEYLAALFLPGRSPLDNYMVQANHPDNYDGGSERDRRMECMTRFLLQLLRGHLDTNTF